MYGSVNLDTIFQRFRQRSNPGTEAAAATPVRSVMDEVMTARLHQSSPLLLMLGVRRAWGKTSAAREAAITSKVGIWLKPS